MTARTWSTTRGRRRECSLSVRWVRQITSRQACRLPQSQSVTSPLCIVGCVGAQLRTKRRHGPRNSPSVPFFVVAFECCCWCCSRNLFLLLFVFLFLRFTPKHTINGFLLLISTRCNEVVLYPGLFNGFSVDTLVDPKLHFFCHQDRISESLVRPAHLGSRGPLEQPRPNLPL